MFDTLKTVIMVLAAAGAAPASADSMSTSKGERPHQCRVVSGDKLPAASGGEAALCAAVNRAFVAHAVGATAQVEVTVLSASRLTAQVIANGRRLPVQGFNSMDRPIARSSLERFAEALARQAAARGK